MNISMKLTGTRIPMHEKLETFVRSKVNEALVPLSDMNLDPVGIDVELEHTTRRYTKGRRTEQTYRAEANLTLPGRFIRVEGTGSSLRTAIVQMKQRLFREVSAWRGRLIDASRSGARRAKEQIAVSALARESPELGSSDH